jgi:demethylmenaquinone methyltransferase / 2-methoxy-6-polyprenyl-1,4-benzoquinol methylase
MSALPSPAEKRGHVERMFDRISGRYDWMNRLMTLGLDRSWRRAAVDALAIRPGDTVLDLGCGTGDLAEEARRRGARVIGVDISSGMLRHALARRISAVFTRADALRLPLADACCDAVVSGFALRNLTDVAVALHEAGRVLRPDGRLALLEVDTPANAALRLGHRLYFETVVPQLGRLLSDGDASAYLPESVAYLPSEPALFAMLREAGFRESRKRRFLGGSAQLVTALRAERR